MQEDGLADQIEVLAGFAEEEALHSVLVCLFEDIMECSIATPTGRGGGGREWKGGGREGRKERRSKWVSKQKYC